jgi:hypothetical protein
MTDRLADLLRARYPAKTHALFFEVRNAAGFSADRSCDAIAMGLWPSRGLKLVGFEFKSSRADWLREYRNPEKADAFAQFCDEWWLVVSGMAIVEPDELPETWGLLVANGARLVCQKEAPKRQPLPINRHLLAALLKRAVDHATEPTDEAFQRGYDAGKKAQLEHSANDRQISLKNYQSLQKVVDDFERASGISIQKWDNGEKIGQAVRTVLNGGHLALQQPIKIMLNQARDLVQRLEHMQESAK